MLKNHFFNLLLSFIAGGTLVLGFAPIHWSFIAFIAPALFLFLIQRAKPKQSFFYGLFYGFGLFGVGTSWVYISVHEFGNANKPLAGFITFLLILLMSLYPATQAYLLKRFFNKHSLSTHCLLLFPATSVIWEGLRCIFMTGFPWLLAGYTQTNNFLSGYAPLFSVFGVSLIVYFFSGAVCLLFTNARARAKLTGIATVILLSVIAIPLHLYHWTTQSVEPISVAMIQGNIPQSLKWDRRQVINNINKYIINTKPYWGTHIILWPEAAIPIAAANAKSLIHQLNLTAKKYNSSLIFGIPITNPNHTKYFNGIMAVGNGHGIYLKRQLVPYGEYIPLPSLITPLMKYFNIPFSNISKGPKKQNHLVANQMIIAPLICYEVVYPWLVIDWARGANLLITINDDSWFGDSLASPQQLQMAQMRSIETERYMLYGSNTGITAIIAPNGRIKAQAPKDTLAVLKGTVYATTGNTPVMKYRYYPLFLVLCFMLMVALISFSLKTKKRIF